MTREQIKSTIEYKYNTRNGFYYLVLGFVCSFLLTYFLHLINKNADSTNYLIYYLPSTIIFGLCLPLSIVSFVDNLIMLKQASTFVVGDAIFEEAHLSTFIRTKAYFTIDVKIDKDTKKVINTKKMFGSNFSLTTVPFEMYNNENVKIAYSSKMDKLIVLGLKDNKEDKKHNESNNSRSNDGNNADA